jgi:hypothetical protein
MSQSTHPVLGRRRDVLVGLAIILVAFAASIVLSSWARSVSEPMAPEPPGPPTTRGIPGWPKRVDAVKALPLARAATPRTELRAIRVDGVSSDGTINARRAGSLVRYSFQSPPGEGPQPPREPETLPRFRYCGRQKVLIVDKGLEAQPDKTDQPCASPPLEALPDPACSLRDVWARALKKGAPKKKRARIDYYRSEAGPAWRFRIPGTRHRMALSGDCKRELQGNESRAVSD